MGLKLKIAFDLRTKTKSKEKLTQMKTLNHKSVPVDVCSLTNGPSFGRPHVHIFFGVFGIVLTQPN